MLPSVSAQKPVVTDPSWVSVDVTLTVIALENALSLDLIRAGYRRLRETCQPIDHSTADHADRAGKATPCGIIDGNMVALQIRAAGSAAVPDLHASG
jgi:hypothetical protein